MTDAGNPTGKDSVASQMSRMDRSRISVGSTGGPTNLPGMASKAAGTADFTRNPSSGVDPRAKRLHSLILEAREYSVH